MSAGPQHPSLGDDDPMSRPEGFHVGGLSEADYLRAKRGLINLAERQKLRERDAADLAAIEAKYMKKGV